MKKKYILLIILATIILFLSIIFINYKIDVFGINSSQKYYYNSAKYERYQNVGLARNYNYDTVVTGTSLSENFKISLLNKFFNVEAIKIPISGGTAKEQSLLLNVAVNNGVKKVFLDVHYNAYSGSSDRMHPSFLFPEYLYDKNMINDFKFYASFDTLILSLKKVFLKDRYFTENFDTLYNWYENEKSNFEKNKVQNYSKSLDTSFTNDYTFNNLKNNFDVNILPIIRDNPSIEFNIFFTPYNVYYFIPFYKEDKLSDLIEFKAYIIEQCLKYSNVNLYDFSIDTEIIEDLDNYKDTHHFSQMISDQILHKMKGKTFRIDDNYKSKYISDYKKYIILKLKNTGEIK